MGTRFRKKPVEVDAIRVSTVWHALTHDTSLLPSWLVPNVERGEIGWSPNVELWIKTLEGTMTAGPTDMVIRGVKGEVYACKADIFDATYEEVPRSANAKGGA